MRRVTQVTKTALDDVDVECTHCQVRMTTHHTEGSRIRYFHCPTCHRWVSSTYTEVFRGDAKVRPLKKEAPATFSFDAVKTRLERWLSALDDQDPFRLLGVTPLDPPERVRDRYRELAREFHPDRGGSTEKMRRLNEAYEKVLRMREQRRLERLEAGFKAPVPQGLPGGR